MLLVVPCALQPALISCHLLHPMLNGRIAMALMVAVYAQLSVWQGMLAMLSQDVTREFGVLWMAHASRQTKPQVITCITSIGYERQHMLVLLKLAEYASMLTFDAAAMHYRNA